LDHLDIQNLVLWIVVSKPLTSQVSDWEKARFQRVEFFGCRAIGAQLIDSEFEDISFKDCNFERAIFFSAKI